MVSVDFRTRFEGDAVDLDPRSFLDDALAEALDARGESAGRAAVRLGLKPLTLLVDGDALTFVPDDRLAIQRAPGDAETVDLDRPRSPTSCKTSHPRSAHR